MTFGGRDESGIVKKKEGEKGNSEKRQIKSVKGKFDWFRVRGYGGIFGSIQKEREGDVECWWGHCKVQGKYTNRGGGLKVMKGSRTSLRGEAAQDETDFKRREKK